MVRLILRTILTLLANAVGLIAAAVLLNDFSINGTAFIVAVVLFTLSTAILGPFIVKMTLRYADYLMGGIALVNTLVALVLTSIFTDGIEVDGMVTWVTATFVVWVFSVIGNIVLPLFLFKKALENKRDQSTEK